MKTTATYFLICLLLAIGIPARSQVSNLDIYNGLPSNHVYSAIVDNYGYLWMCTTNGVVRYDGYQLKTFSYADGLPTTDVWGLHLDYKGRIWLRCFSDKIGYIFKDKYHEAYLETSGQTLSPRHITDYSQGILFLTRTNNTSQLKKNRGTVVCIEKNDTISFTGNYMENGDVTGSNEALNFWNDTVRTYEVDQHGILQPVKTCLYLSGDIRRQSLAASVVQHHILNYVPGANTIFAFDIHNCSTSVLQFEYAPQKKDSIVFVDFCKQFIYVMGAHTIYKLDSNLNTVQRYTVSSLSNNKFNGRAVTNFFDDPFWGKCTTTQSNGAYFSFGEEHFFKPLNIPDNYSYLGRLKDTLALFWNNQHKMLMSINERGITSYRQINELNRLMGIVPYNDSFSLLLTYFDVLLISNKNLAITSFPAKKEPGQPYFSTNDGFFKKRLMNMKSLAVDNAGIMYACANGLKKITIKDTAVIENINEDLYHDIVFDPFRNAVWIYNDNLILLYRKNGANTVINATSFRKQGISNIGKILVDAQYGNILVQDCNNLFSYDFTTGKITRLFSNYNLQNAKCYLAGGKIIVAGSFGVLFSKIKGLNKWSAPVVSPNIKNGQYLQAENAIILRNKMFLKTDRNNYLLDVPADSIFERNTHSFGPVYKFIVSYGDTVFALQGLPHLPITQRNNKLQFSVINPQGNGTVRYRYFISGTDNKWHDLNANELVLPKLEPDKDYTLSVVAKDNVWNSNKASVVLHVIPYWWQTTRWRIVIIVGLGTILVFSLLGIILMTRYYVEKKGRKKQFLTELELRSIYAQINPHFIFNTLNTALYFIRQKRLDDAYAHVSKFSRLLWAYLESSRNRYITVNDEINNIRNYLELQRTRFDNAFTYEILLNNVDTPHKIKIPSLLLQPIVENAINHGLIPKEGAGHLKIAFSRNEESNDITCVIDDDGVGRKKEKKNRDEEPGSKRSYGNELIKELVSVFNRYEKMGIEIVYVDKQLPLTGTIVIINIKNPQYANVEYEKV